MDSEELDAQFEIMDPRAAGFKRLLIDKDQMVMENVNN